jgi:multiple sugar transport system ATP-binding protein
MSQLYLDHLVCQIEKKTILNNISFELKEKKFIVILGPSGCGKSTLLSVIAGFQPLKSGAVFLNQKDITSYHPRHRNIGMVFQNYALYPHMTVRENLDFGMRMRGVKTEERKKRILKTAELLKMTPYLDRGITQLSGGQKQRVAIGRAFIRETAELYLFDEPLSNLDAQLRLDMRYELKKLFSQSTSPFLYVTHDQIEAMTMADDIILLKDGMIQQIGTPYDLYHFPKNEFVAQFIGQPSMNFLSLEHLPSLNLPPSSKWGIRPEHLSLEQSESSWEIKTKLDFWEYTGHDYFLYTHTPLGEKVTLKVPIEGPSSISHQALKVGTDLTVYLPHQYVHQFGSDGHRVPSVPFH